MKQTAKDLNYCPNMMAKGLVGGRTNSIGIIMGTLSDLFHVGLVNGAEECFSRNGYSVIFYLTHFNNEKVFESISNLLSRGVDGVIMLGVQTVHYAQVLERLNAAKCPVALYEFPVTTGLDNVIYRNEKNTGMVVEHLYSLGHRRIALLEEKVGSWREPSFRAAMKDFNLEVLPDYIQKIDPANMEISIKHCRQSLMSMKRRPTAIFAYNDDVAMSLIKDLVQSGYKIPEDVSVVGINGLWYTQMTAIPLTTLELPCEEAGRACAELLIDRIKCPSTSPVIKELEGRLLVRESTASPPED